MAIGLAEILILSIPILLIAGIYLLVTKGKSKSKLLWGIILTVISSLLILIGLAIMLNPSVLST